MKEEIRKKLEAELNYYRSRNRELEVEASEIQRKVDETSGLFEETVEEMGELDDLIEELQKDLEGLN